MILHLNSFRKKIIHKFVIILTCIMLVFGSTIQKSKAFDLVVTPTVIATTLIGLCGIAGVILNNEAVKENINDFVDHAIISYQEFYGGALEEAKEAVSNICSTVYNSGKALASDVNEWLHTWLNSFINGHVLANYVSLSKNAIAQMGDLSVRLAEPDIIRLSSGLSVPLYTETWNSSSWPFNYEEVPAMYFDTGVPDTISFVPNLYASRNNPPIIQVTCDMTTKWSSGEPMLYYYRGSQQELFRSPSTMTYDGSKWVIYPGVVSISNLFVVSTESSTLITPSGSSISFFPGKGYTVNNGDTNIDLTDFKLLDKANDYGDVFIPNKHLDSYNQYDNTIDLSNKWLLGKDATFNSDGTLSYPGSIAIPHDIPQDWADDESYPLVIPGVYDDVTSIPYDDVIASNPDYVTDIPGNPVLPPGTIETPDFEYGADWTRVFPFCIPFDIFKFLNLFCAEPVAPRFDFDYNFYGISGTLVIDLEKFDGVAKTCRTLFNILFIVGLAMVTRNNLIKS